MLATKRIERYENTKVCTPNPLLAKVLDFYNDQIEVSGCHDKAITLMIGGQLRTILHGSDKIHTTNIQEMVISYAYRM